MRDVQYLAQIWQAVGLWQAGRSGFGGDWALCGIEKASDETYRVARAVDRSKDQSYVLFGLRPELLPRVLFPVGGFTKTEIRG